MRATLTCFEVKQREEILETLGFEGSKSNILKQIGNAVPCGLSIAIAKEIKKMLEKK